MQAFPRAVSSQVHLGAPLAHEIDKENVQHSIKAKSKAGIMKGDVHLHTSSALRKQPLTHVPNSVKSKRFQPSPADAKLGKQKLQTPGTAKAGPRTMLRDITNQTPGPNQLTTTIKKSKATTIKSVTAMKAPGISSIQKNAHNMKSVKQTRVWVDQAASPEIDRPEVQSVPKRIVIPDIPPKDESDFEYMPPKPAPRGYIPSKDEILDFDAVFKPPCFQTKKQREIVERLLSPPMCEFTVDDLYESLPPVITRDTTPGSTGDDLEDYPFDSSCLLV